HRVAPGLRLGRRGGAAAGPRRRTRGRLPGGRQRAQGHARAAGRVRRRGRHLDPSRRRLLARHTAAPRPGPAPHQETRWRSCMIRICLVDDQTLVRQGIRSLLALAEGMEVVGEAADGKQALELIPGLKPDVVLMDMRMPAMSGLEALQALARIDALPPTIILTTFDDDQLVLAGLKAGAK